MAVLMKQYGRTVLCCAAVFFIFGILSGIRVDGNTGFIRIAYAKAAEGTAGADAGQGLDVDTVLSVAARKKPEIVFQYTKVLSQEKMNLNKMFSALDADGQEAFVTVTDVLDSDADSIMYPSKEDRKNQAAAYPADRFVFPRPGIYTIKVKAADREHKTAAAQYRIPVTGN